MNAKRKLTQEKRKTQTCKAYQVKIDKSHLSQADIDHLNTLFKEAKWFYNYCLNQCCVEDVDTKLKIVPVYIKDHFENRHFTVLPAQVKQSLKEKIFSSLKTLNTRKERGYKVGKLKFKKYINSIPLRQYNTNYNIGKNKIRLQKMRWLRVNGLNQIPANVEFANANLIRRNDNFYLHITTFTNKTEELIPEKSIGIDFGCRTQLSFSDNIKIKFQVKISKKIKRLDRKIMKKNRKDSKNKRKDQAKRRKAYEKLTNKKNDIRHKIVNAIVSNFKYVIFQDENIKGWQASGHSREVLETAKLEETLPSTFFNTLNMIHGIKVSKVESLSQEASKQLKAGH